MTSMQCVTAMSNASMAATMISIILNFFIPGTYTQI